MNTSALLLQTFRAGFAAMSRIPESLLDAQMLHGKTVREAATVDAIKEATARFHGELLNAYLSARIDADQYAGMLASAEAMADRGVARVGELP